VRTPYPWRKDFVVDQVGDEVLTLLEGCFMGVERLPLIEQAIHDQPACQAAEVYCRIGCGHRFLNSCCLVVYPVYCVWSSAHGNIFTHIFQVIKNKE
jgi:hypothetical protein